MTGHDHRETVVVIGAGIIGIACAHYLSKAGFKVCVIDSGTVAGACSQGNCGHILPSHILPLNGAGVMSKALASLFRPSSPFRIKIRPDPAFVNWMTQFARFCHPDHVEFAASQLKHLLESSFEQYQELVATPGFDCEWRNQGLIHLFEDEKNFDNFSRENDYLNEKFRLSAREITADQLASFDPAFKDGLAGGFYYENDARLSPEKLSKAWPEILQKEGVEFIENCVFEAAEINDGRVSAIRTSEGIFEARHIVLAAGAFSRRLARHFGRSIPVEPGKGYAITLPAPELLPKSSIVLPERHIAITPFNDSLRIGSIMEFTGFDEKVPSRRVAQLRRGAADFLRSPLSPDILKEWFGFRPMTPDSLPLIGRFSHLKNAYLATGHQMIGMMAAPATGKLVAELVSGTTPHIPDAAFSPARFGA